MGKEVMLLDCTLRDGGMELEDAGLNGLDVHFNDKAIDESVKALIASSIDIVEIGCVEKNDRDARRYGLFQDIEGASRILNGRMLNERQTYATMYRTPDVPLEEIPRYREGLCEVVRVMIRYSELKKSLDFGGGLAKKGYKVFIQPAITMRYTEQDVCELIEASNAMNAYALYIVDSYGYMQEVEMAGLLEKYDKGLKPEIAVGFHGHNNMNLAFANAKYFLEYPTDRKRIIDSTAIGMGQGAGNLQTEVIVPYLNAKYGKRYDYASVLDLCDVIEPLMISKSLWGYNVERTISAVNRTSYKYGSALRERWGLSFREIESILSNMPEEFVQRYTKDNVESLARNYLKEKFG